MEEYNFLTLQIESERRLCTAGGVLTLVCNGMYLCATIYVHFNYTQPHAAACHYTHVTVHAEMLVLSAKLIDSSCQNEVMEKQLFDTNEETPNCSMGLSSYRLSHVTKLLVSY